MSTLFNIWHYLVVCSGFLILGGGVFLALKQEGRGSKLSVLFFITLLAFVVSGMGMVAVDKYTKVVKLYKLEDKRNLNTEQMSFSGIIKNEGKYEIGEVTFEVKLVNQGASTNNLSGGSFYSPAIFMDFFGLTSDDGSKKGARPQQIIHTFVVAKNLKPGAVEDFRVYVDYPPYFKGVAYFADVYGH